MRNHRRNSVDPDRSHCRRGPACGNTRTGRIGLVGLPCAPPAKPKVCWTGSSMDATIKQHPSSLARCRTQWLIQLASGVTAASAYFGMSALQRRCSAQPSCPARRPHIAAAPRYITKRKLPQGQTTRPWMAARGRPSREVTEVINTRNPKPRSESRKSAVRDRRSHESHFCRPSFRGCGHGAFSTKHCEISYSRCCNQRISRFLGKACLQHSTGSDPEVNATGSQVLRKGRGDD